MKRYLLFDGEAYYPGGGWADFRGSFDTVDEAKAAFEQNPSDWAHIVDFESGVEILQCFPDEIGYSGKYSSIPWETIQQETDVEK